MTDAVSQTLAGVRRWGVACSDALAFLKTMPDNCVHMIGTSPPFWGLRDYGTGTWEGGSPDCDHAPVTGMQGTTGDRAGRAFTGAKPQGQTCSRCGANRVDRQIGLEATVDGFVERLVEVFREARRVLHPSGVLYLNLGDSYATGAGSARQPGGTAAGKHNWNALPVEQPNRRPQPGLKPKDRAMVPPRVAMALQADGWWLRDEIIWHKPSPMPTSTKDRTTYAHEMVYMLTKSRHYFYDAEAIAEPASTAGGPIKTADGWDTGGGAHGTIHREGREKGETRGATQPPTRNKRSVWKISSSHFKGSHFATFPPKLVTPWVLAGTSARGVCPKCLEPWTRLVKRNRKATRTPVVSKVIDATDPTTSGSEQRLKVGNSDPLRRCTTTETTGWRPGCKCDAGEPISALCCDPFMGSGTVAAVAVGLGRRCVGSELNPQYVPLIERRMAAVTPQIPGLMAAEGAA